MVGQNTRWALCLSKSDTIIGPFAFVDLISEGFAPNMVVEGQKHCKSKVKCGDQIFGNGTRTNVLILFGCPTSSHDTTRQSDQTWI